MAFLFTHPFAQAYQAPHSHPYHSNNYNNPFSACGSVSRPAYTYRVSRPRPQPQRAVLNSFNLTSLFTDVDALLSDINREAERQAHVEAQREAQLKAHALAQRELHRHRHQRKQAHRAQFAVQPTEAGWEIQGDIVGFAPGQIRIEVEDGRTVRVGGSTAWEREDAQPVPAQSGAQAVEDDVDGATLHEPEPATTSTAQDAAQDTKVADADTTSETASHHSYQATVEDDFEDLGAETSSLLSASSSSESRSASPAKEVAEPESESKDKEKQTVAESSTTTATRAEAQPQPAPKQNEEEQPHASFTRTFRFPVRIDGANVQASFSEGVLRISVPRAVEEGVRRVAIL